MNKKMLQIILGLFLITACSQQPDTLTVMTHDSFTISEAVINAFEQEQNIEVVFLPSGDAGSILNRAILSKDAPIADVLYGIDNTYLSRAMDEDMFEAYDSPLLVKIPDEFKLDNLNRALPINYGDVCINYDKNYFSENDLALPTSLIDLIDPKYAGLLVVENPATSSPGLAFLLATISEFGDEGYLDYWENLKGNGVVVANDWETAYYTNFSGSAGRGAQPMVVSYGTSPAAEFIFSEEEVRESPTASLVAENMCYRQIEFVGILKGSKNRDLAEKFIDYMLSVGFQEDIPLNMFVFPVNQEAVVQPIFLDHIQIPQFPAVISTDRIAEMRETWIESWREQMLQ
jgi:thiamine transport system substrate-binding protein